MRAWEVERERERVFVIYNTHTCTIREEEVLKLHVNERAL